MFTATNIKIRNAKTINFVKNASNKIKVEDILQSLVKTVTV